VGPSTNCTSRNTTLGQEGRRRTSLCSKWLCVQEMDFLLTLLNQNSPLETIIDLTGVDVDIVVHDMDEHGVGERMEFR
jgi:hypothetical protein